MHSSLILSSIMLLAPTILAMAVPSNIADLYNSIRAAGQCTNKLASGFVSSSSSKGATFSYCADHDREGIIYIQGTSGALANMDIDCDGNTHDSRCGGGDMQYQTSFKDEVRRYGAGIDDLDAGSHSYVVLGNVGSRAGYVSFDPRSVGVEALSLVAVVCGDKMVSSPFPLSPFSIFH